MVPNWYIFLVDFAHLKKILIYAPDELMRDEKSTRINEVDISQPSTVAIQLCLVDLLKSWNITPAAVTSHSRFVISLDSYITFPFS